MSKTTAQVRERGRSSVRKRRRAGLSGLASLFLFAAWARPAAGPPVPHHAQGEKAGEPTQNSIILLTRLTAVERGEIECDVPGQDGWARFEVSETKTFKPSVKTPWMRATAENDHTIKRKVAGLKAGRSYFYRVHITDPTRKRSSAGPARGFKAAPSPDEMRDVSFVVITGQGYGSRDDDRGHHAYLAMERIGLDFIALTGDTVYYDGAAGGLS